MNSFPALSVQEYSFSFFGQADDYLMTDQIQEKPIEIINKSWDLSPKMGYTCGLAQRETIEG